MKLITESLLVLLLLIVVVFGDDILNHLSTRTPYRFVSNVNDTEITFRECVPKKIWMLVRHGTRQPSRKDVLSMQTTLLHMRHQILTRHQQSIGTLNATDLAFLQRWNLTLKEEEAKTLTIEGQEEMRLLAQRMQKRFPTLITDHFDNHTFLFRFTATERAEESAKYFSEGLFTTSRTAHVWYPQAQSFDPILRFYKHCDKWKKEVKKNPDTYIQLRAFSISKAMNDTLNAIAERIGYDYIDIDTADLMYKICGFEVSWNKTSSSPWCSLFDLQDMKVFEYYHDLKHYWQDSYGHRLNYKQACFPVKDMFTQFSDPNRAKASFLFAHSGTVLKTLAHVGLNKPKQHLNGSTFDDKRVWRTSVIDAFASNLAFVLFNCSNKEHILTLQQEKPVILPMCKSELCPMDLLVNHFRRSIEECDFEEMCSLKKRRNDEL